MTEKKREIAITIEFDPDWHNGEWVAKDADADAKASGTE